MAEAMANEETRVRNRRHVVYRSSCVSHACERPVAYTVVGNVCQFRSFYRVTSLREHQSTALVDLC